MTHLDMLHGSIHFSFDANARPKRWESFTFVDGVALLNRFKTLGIRLRTDWNMAEFEAAQSADMRK